jgi:hypothetical protein
MDYRDVQAAEEDVRPVGVVFGCALWGEGKAGTVEAVRQLLADALGDRFLRYVDPDPRNAGRFL